MHGRLFFYPLLIRDEIHRYRINTVPGIPLRKMLASENVPQVSGVVGSNAADVNSDRLLPGDKGFEALRESVVEFHFALFLL